MLLSVFWGTNIVASRFAIGEIDPLFFIFLRLAIAVVFFVPILLFTRGGFPSDPELLKNGAISGIFGVAIPMSTFILSLQYQSSGVTSIYVTLSPVIIVVAAHFLLPDEKMTRQKALGGSVALAGALFLALSGESGLQNVGRASPLGFGMVMIGLFSEAGNTMFVRRNMKAADPIQVTAIRLFVAALIVLAVTAFFGEFSLSGIQGPVLFSLAYAGLVGALAGQFLAFYIQRTFGATAFSLTAYLIPLVATLSGALFLNELITWKMGIGGLLIGFGVYIINRRSRSTPPGQRPAAVSVPEETPSSVSGP